MSDKWTHVVSSYDGSPVVNGVKLCVSSQLARVLSLDSSLRNGSDMRSIIITAALILMVPQFVHAEQSSATMNVSVRVLARAIVNVDSAPSIDVTDADLQRGYVDVAEPLQMHVRTNSRQGYLLQVSKTNDAFSTVELSFGNTTMTVSEESWVARPQVSGGELVSAQMRVRLAPGATAGRHSLPVQISASPL
jgi:hypothetical protein